MAGDERVRFCSECTLNVYNLSEMTRREAEQLIATHEGRLCVRFYRRADGTIITQNCPRGLRVLIQRVSRVAGAALSAIMGLGFAVAQMPQQMSCSQPASKEPAHDGLSVLILDPQGAAVSGARVSLKGPKRKNRWTATSDAAGVATFRGLPPGDYSVKVEVQGFKTLKQQMKVDKDNISTKTLKVTVGDTTVVVGMLDEPMIIGTRQYSNEYLQPSAALAGRRRQDSADAQLKLCRPSTTSRLFTSGSAAAGLAPIQITASDSSRSFFLLKECFPAA
ncbi:MAG TPA: carboxypeptidase-like regulatory domain-containing protein [Candidatus Angelobacter sp.]